MPDRYVWTAADGTTVELSDRAAGYIVTADGTTGLRSPSYSFTTREYAGIDGADLVSLKAAAATPTLGLYVSATSYEQSRAKLSSLRRALRPKAGIGTLAVSNDSGDTRTLACYYTGGLEDAVIRPSSFKAALKFLAPDPWWSGDQQTISVGLGAGTTFFPFFPLVLAPSTVQGQFTVDLSDSDAPSWPIWTVTGPGSSLVLTNQTSGESLSLDVTLAAGQSLTVDTRPQVRTVRRDDGVNLMPQVTPGTDPALWPLYEGVNSVSVSLTGATDASRVVGVYEPRYAGI